MSEKVDHVCTKSCYTSCFLTQQWVEIKQIPYFHPCCRNICTVELLCSWEPLGRLTMPPSGSALFNEDRRPRLARFQLLKLIIHVLKKQKWDDWQTLCHCEVNESHLSWRAAAEPRQIGVKSKYIKEVERLSCDEATAAALCTVCELRVSPSPEPAWPLTPQTGSCSSSRWVWGAKTNQSTRNTFFLYLRKFFCFTSTY